jgi:hypothetical protein
VVLLSLPPPSPPTHRKNLPANSSALDQSWVKVGSWRAWRGESFLSPFSHRSTRLDGGCSRDALKILPPPHPVHALVKARSLLATTRSHSEIPELLPPYLLIASRSDDRGASRKQECSTLTGLIRPMTGLVWPMTGLGWPMTGLVRPKTSLVGPINCDNKFVFIWHFDLAA